MTVNQEKFDKLVDAKIAETAARKALTIHHYLYRDICKECGEEITRDHEARHLHMVKVNDRWRAGKVKTLAENTQRQRAIVGDWENY
jgi:hypothetical protein